MLKYKKKASEFRHLLVFFSIFGLKIRAFDEVHDYLILYFAVVFPA